MRSPSGVVELGREGARADARGVGLGDAPDLVDRARPDAGADAGGARDRVGRGDERIGAVVDVEHGALRPLEDHEAAVVEHAPGDRRGVGDVAARAGGRGCGTPRSSCAGRAPGPWRTDAASGAWARARRRSSCAGSSRRAGPACGCRGAPPCRRSRGRCRGGWCRSGACRACASPAWSSSLWYGMIRCALAEMRSPLMSMRRREQLGDLLGQHLRVDHHAVADRADLARVEDPRRDQVELEGLAVADDRVAGVVAALEADHEVGLLGEQVDDLALALVAPLGAHDHQTGHRRIECRGQGARRPGRPCAGPGP